MRFTPILTHLNLQLRSRLFLLLIYATAAAADGFNADFSPRCAALPPPNASHGGAQKPIVLRVTYAMHRLSLPSRGTQLANGPGGGAQIEEEHRGGSGGIDNAAKHLNEGVCVQHRECACIASIGGGVISASVVVYCCCCTVCCILLLFVCSEYRQFFLGHLNYCG